MDMKILIVVLVAIALVALTAVILFFSLQSSGNLYKDPNGWFSIEKPEGWKITPVKSTAITFTKSSDLVFGVSVHDFNQEIDSESALKLFKSALLINPGFSEKQTNDIEVFGLEAKEFLYSINSGFLKANGKVVILTKDGVIYSLSYTASEDEYEKNLPHIDRSISSFKILK